jgi:hypothetical protein
MSRLQVGVVRYAAVASAIGRSLGVEPEPDCRIGHGRITLTFRRLGASHWSEERQIVFALRAAASARAILRNDRRRAALQRADRAIVIVFEDASLVRGCAVNARWECVVPASEPRESATLVVRRDRER